MLSTESKPWDFSLAHDALSVFPTYLNTTRDNALQGITEYERSHSPTLGDFSTIFKLREIEVASTETQWLRSESDDALESSSTSSSVQPDDDGKKVNHATPITEDSSYSTPASSPPELAITTIAHKASQDSRWKDDVDRAIKIRTRARSRNETSQATSTRLIKDNEVQCVISTAKKVILHGHPENREVRSGNITSGSLGILQSQNFSIQPSPKVHFALNAVSSTEPSPPPVPHIDLRPRVIAPLIRQTFAQKQGALLDKLGKINEKTLSTATAQVWQSNIQSTKSHPGNSKDIGGIHVFVDSSNTVIGFQNALKKARNMNQNTYVRRPPISFPFLALILERGREVMKRVLVGSSRLGIRPDYMSEAESCGYEVSVLEHVTKMKMKVSKAGSGQRRSGNGTSGYSSGSDARVATRAVTEQGVDEIIHMKMLESLVDTQQPATIVLASGDAAEAEYSGGFLKNVVRALEAGWNVEIVAWRNNIGYAYRSHKFQRAWKNQFRIIELDDFCEELLAVYETA